MTWLTRRAFVAGSAASAWSSGAKARSTSHVFMVLGRGENDNETGFRDELARRGVDVTYTVRNTGGDPSKLPAIVDEIRSVRPDLIYS